MEAGMVLSNVTFSIILVAAFVVESIEVYVSVANSLVISVDICLLVALLLFMLDVNSRLLVVLSVDPGVEGVVSVFLVHEVSFVVCDWVDLVLVIKETVLLSAGKVEPAIKCREILINIISTMTNRQ